MTVETALNVDMQRAAMDEIGRLIKSVKKGNLTDRADLKATSSDYKEVLVNVNEMLDAVLLPIGEGNRILDQIAHGKVDELIAQTYEGDHEKMKQNVNGIALVLQKFQAEMARLTEFSQQGQLEKRGDAARSRAPMARSSKASMRCSTPFCCRSAKAIASSTRSPMARSTN